MCMGDLVTWVRLSGPTRVKLEPIVARNTGKTLRSYPCHKAGTHAFARWRPIKDKSAAGARRVCRWNGKRSAHGPASSRVP